MTLVFFVCRVVFFPAVYYMYSVEHGKTLDIEYKKAGILSYLHKSKTNGMLQQFSVNYVCFSYRCFNIWHDHKTCSSDLLNIHASPIFASNILVRHYAQRRPQSHLWKRQYYQRWLEKDNRCCVTDIRLKFTHRHNIITQIRDLVRINSF